MIAFFVGIVVFIICATITSERKSLIPEKIKTVIKDVSKKSKEVPAKESATPAKTEPEFKNSAGLNILLYVGCFLIIAALMGYVSTVDEELIPPIVLTVTTLALVASILIFKFVKFLKPSSYAFNVSSLVMFLFWIPSLEALGLDYGYAALASFFFLTGASIVSAAIFKHKALWYVPAFSAIGLIICTLGVIDMEIDLNDALLVYGAILGFMALAITCRFFWKAKVTWLPVQTRHATRSFSFIYPVIAGFFALAGADNIDEYPFALTLFAVLLSFYLALDSILFRKKSLISILRVCLEVVCITTAIDICFGLVPNASDSVHRNVVLATILVSSFIQAFISVIFFAVKHDEESHAHERFVFAAAITGFAIVSMMSSPDSSYASYVPDRDMLGALITIGAQLSIIVFALIAMLLDRNPLMLIIAALGICDASLTNLESTPTASCIILSICAVIFSITYLPLRKLYEKHSLAASISSAVIAAVIALYLGDSESVSYIPILAIGLSMAIQGLLLNKAGIRIAGFYLTAFGIIAAWLSARDGFLITTRTNIGYGRVMHSYPVWVHAVDTLLCFIPAGAAFLLSLFDKAKEKTLKDGTATKNFTVNYIIGFVLAVFSVIILVPDASQDVEFFGFTLSLIILITLLIWSAAKKWIGFEIAALCAILILVLENVGDNIWITMSLAGVGIISIVVFISYKNYKKLGNNQQAVAPTATPAPKAEETKTDSKPKESSAPKPESKDKEETK